MCEDKQTQQADRRAARGYILEIYTALFLAVFPFYNTDHYFSVLSDRAGFFQIVTWAMAVTLLVEEGLHRFRTGKDARMGSVREWVKKIPLEYVFLAAFLLGSAVSTLLSDYRTEAWNGAAGRLQGLSMWLSYGAVFFCIARFHHPGKRHIWIFLVSGTIVALWGICDYIGLGLSWWLADVKESQKHMFTSSIGNINTYTAFLAIGFSLSGAYAVYQDIQGQWIKRGTLALLSVFFLFTIALITGRSDNAVIGVAAFFLAVPLWIQDTRRAARYLMLLAVFFIAFPAAALLSVHTVNPYMEVPDGILLKVGIRGRLLFLLASITFLAAAFCLSRKEKPLSHRLRWIWLACLAVSGIFLILIFLYVNFCADAGRYGAAETYLKFNDDWGTSRGLCWRLAYESYGKFPLFKKFIGSGPETFGIIMKQEHYQEMLQRCGQVFDSPHNEFIQYLFCTGILGAIFYYAFLVSCFLKGMCRDTVGKAAAIAILVYTAVSFVNISVPITQPYSIMFAAWCSSQKNKERRLGIPKVLGKKNRSEPKEVRMD